MLDFNSVYKVHIFSIQFIYFGHALVLLSQWRTLFLVWFGFPVFFFLL